MNTIDQARIRREALRWLIILTLNNARPVGAFEGPILSVMAKLVNLDPRRYGPGTATRTGLEHMSVFVIRPAPGRLTVLGMRSAAGSLWHALETAVARIAA